MATTRQRTKKRTAGATQSYEPAPPLVLRLAPAIRLTPDQLFELCRVNDELRIERTSEGDLVIMPPTNSETGNTNFGLAVRFGVWVEADGRGLGFDSSAGFTLPNGAMRSPDVSWIRRTRWEALPAADRRTFAHVCPDFVLELRSPSDPLRFLEAKMQEYIDNGAQLGWLIDPIQRQAHVYRPGAPPQVLDRPDSLSGDPVLPGFVLDLRSIWAE